MDGILAPWHWIILIGVALLVFGPKKLPEMGNSIGKGIAGFRRGLKETQDEVTTAMAEPTVPATAATPSLPETLSAAAASSDAEREPEA
jgi:sec-independent protein translocase protein TatA